MASMDGLLQWLTEEESPAEEVVFDWNGTLVDDVETCVAIINGMLPEYGLAKISQEDYLQHFNFPVVEYYEWLGFDFSKVDFQKVSRQFMDQYLAVSRDCGLFAGARELVAGLKRRGVRCHVLTASKQSIIDDWLGDWDLRDWFDEVYGIGDIHAQGKTQRGLELIQRLGSTSRVIMLGDTVHDHEVAESMGIASVLLTGGHQDARRLTATGAPVFDRHRGLFL